MSARAGGTQVGEALRSAASRLDGGVDARTDAEMMLASVLGRDRAWFIAHRDELLDDAALARFAKLVELRAAGHPVAYLTGRRGFWSLELAVTPDTLIPRAETELLVQLALERISADTRSRIVDLGTGSGAIALAIARERPHAALVAVDHSAAALRVAEANARAAGIGNVAFVEGSWFDALSLQDPFDLVVSNPPYLASDDPHLSQGDLRFEPRSALASGMDGLDALRTIVGSARARLVDGGWLLLEHGLTQGPGVRALLAVAGFENVQTWPDLAGRDRVSGGTSADGELDGRDGGKRSHG